MQKLTYRTIEEEYRYELPKIRWSRFITYLLPCKTKEDIPNVLYQIKKEHFSATHHCFAWRFWVQTQRDLFWNTLISPQYVKCDDNGEPSNTAWKPILNVLEWENLLNIIAIVVRYFGGTLLWVWWLIQAYTQATKEAIKMANIIEKEILKEFKLIHDYNQTALVAHLIEKYDIKLISEVCSEKNTKILAINLWVIQDFKEELAELSNGSLDIN